METTTRSGTTYEILKEHDLGNPSPRSFDLNEFQGRIVVKGHYSCYGWMSGRNTVHKGDFLHVPMESGKTGKYQLLEVRYKSDPYDMFTADMNPVGYVDI